MEIKCLKVTFARNARMKVFQFVLDFLFMKDSDDRFSKLSNFC